MVEILLSLMCRDRMAEIGVQLGNKRRAVTMLTMTNRCRTPWQRLELAQATSRRRSARSVSTADEADEADEGNRFGRRSSVPAPG